MSTAPTAAQDPLLAELNGALQGPDGQGPIAKELGKVAGDFDLEQPPTLASRLETKPAQPIKPSPRAALVDKTHSKAAGGNGYRVVVEGQYYARSTDAKGNVTKQYRLPFNLPSLVNAKGESALGIIVGASRPGGGLLKAALQKLDPLAITYRTHEIVETTPLNGAPESTSLSYMSFDALKDYVRKNLPDFPITNLDDYASVAHLRDDIIDFKTNEVTDVIFERGTLAESKLKGGFGIKKTPSDRIRERHADRKYEAELAAMNEGVL